MTPTQFTDLQEGLVGVFAPILMWCLTLIVAFGFISAVGWIFLTLFRVMTRGG